MQLTPFAKVSSSQRAFLGMVLALLALAVSLAATAISITTSARRGSSVESIPDPTITAETGSPCWERCELPAGLEGAALSQETADYLSRRGALCADLECGRIEREEYEAAIVKLDESRVVDVAVEKQWATAVLAMSSQYTTDDWSASRVLGPTDVYPRSGDDVNAWASLEQDSAVEFLELAVPRGRIRSVEVYETYNPGAVTHIELVTADGRRHNVYSGEPSAMSEPAFVRRADFSCTNEEIVAVRVTLDSRAVAGWNEIDAVAVTPCR